MTIPAIPAHLIATDADGRPIDQLGRLDVDLAGYLALLDDPHMRAESSDLLAEDDDHEIAQARDWAVSSVPGGQAFDHALQAMPHAGRIATWLQIPAASRDKLAAVGRPQRPDPDPKQVRDRQIDAVKRCFAVSKRVAATIVDTGQYDHPSLPDDVEPDDVEVVAGIAGDAADPAIIATLLRIASQARLKLVGHRSDAYRIVRADGWDAAAVTLSDFQVKRDPKSMLDRDWEPTGLTADAPPMKVVRLLMHHVGMTPRQHCDACGQLLQGRDGCGAVDLDRPWCQACCDSTDVFACEPCGKAATVETGHRNNCGYWCDDCHDPSDHDTVCDLHDNACVDSPPEDRYMVVNVGDGDDAGLAWSNEHGWVDPSQADRFTVEETGELDLPFDGQWQQA